MGNGPELNLRVNFFFHFLLEFVRGTGINAEGVDEFVAGYDLASGRL